MHSIAWRIRRTFFLIILGMVCVMALLVTFVNEDLEQTMLGIDLAEETEFFLRHHTGDEAVRWESAAETALFVPGALQGSEKVQPVFADLPEKYSGEVELGERTYLVKIDNVKNGKFYIAKDITRFENREALFNTVLFLVSAAILGLSYALSIISSQKLVKPLQQLASRIRSTSVAVRMSRLPVDYQETELAAIAETFNEFLAELESFVQREHALVNMASHELRTPIAVIAGALDVLEQRSQLQANDAATLQRIRQANSDMQQNVQALLKLARREESSDAHENVPISSLIEQVIEDLSAQFDVYKRIDWKIGHAAQQHTDPTVAKMLIRNLLQNALQHTSGEVSVRLQQDCLEISDRGSGLPASQKELLTSGFRADAGNTRLSGLGLYLATIIGERLHWKIDVNQTEDKGTSIRVIFS